MRNLTRKRGKTKMKRRKINERKMKRRMKRRMKRKSTREWPVICQCER